MPPPLPALGVLAGLTAESLATLSAFGKYHEVAIDEVVICENQRLDRFYVVIFGKLEIYSALGSSNLALHVAEAGECLGEVSLLDPGTATATVKALTECLLWSMGLDDLRAFLKKDVCLSGALLLAVGHCIALRIRHADDLILKSQERPKIHDFVRTAPPIRATVPPPPITGSFFSGLKSVLGVKKKGIPTEIKM